MLRECDYSQALLEQVNQAISDKTPLVIQGSNSKAFLGRPVTGQTGMNNMLERIGAEPYKRYRLYEKQI